LLYSTRYCDSMSGDRDNSNFCNHNTALAHMKREINLFVYQQMIIVIIVMLS
jgi:hypothetical protein